MRMLVRRLACFAARLCSAISMLLPQRRDRPATVGDDRLRPALWVGPVGAEIDAEVAVDGGPQVGGGDAAFLHVVLPLSRSLTHCLHFARISLLVRRVVDRFSTAFSPWPN